MLQYSTVVQYRIEQELKRGGTVVIRILTELVRFQINDPSAMRNGLHI